IALENGTDAAKELSCQFVSSEAGQRHVADRLQMSQFVGDALRFRVCGALGLEQSRPFALGTPTLGNIAKYHDRADDSPVCRSNRRGAVVDRNLAPVFRDEHRMVGETARGT